ncbi:SDR family oxidoreductase [Phragmitibacter flavus]|uniref:SDR family oxidoreductase n=1 Tax=Phragmitibacter flavus TaxID=2576071 RepID=A0A5R8KKH6_9BACT|nr:SDR family oxidoreductase [Phragmitibacter flavus]TLD72834.1 SDR family oxidoreductase [Phragmitibacter flavus]
MPLPSPISISGQSAIVTGGSKGIGKGIARVLAGSGAKVLIVARNPDDGRSAVNDIIAEGGIASFHPADLSNAIECEGAVAKALELYGKLDILCSNAGAFPSCNLADMTEPLWDELMAQNVRSTAFMVKAAMVPMSAQKYGRIVLTSSITGPLTGYPGWSHYGATKAAQLGFMRTAALELAPHGITINAVLPGNITTEAIIAMGPAYTEATAKAIPAKTLGDVEDIGYAALFLASPQAKFITAQTLVIDGGQVVPEIEAAIL